MKKSASPLIIGIIILIGLTGCSDADVVNQNINSESKQFNVARRLVFLNGITDKYLFVVEGKCTVDGKDWDGNIGSVLSVVCKVGDGENDYKKHYLGLSDNVTFFVEQLESKNVSKYHYKVIFKPRSIIPDVEIK